MTPENQEVYEQSWRVLSWSALGSFMFGGLSAAIWAAASAGEFATAAKFAGMAAAFFFVVLAFVFVASMLTHLAEEGQKKNG
jgi:hypothetical protein